MPPRPADERPGLAAVTELNAFGDNESRALSLQVHARIRNLILSGELAPGSVLLQAQLARRLGVSRTPMREAFRLLQEEGLIEAKPDQRARVRAVDAGDLDSTYGSRIMLEALGVSVTVRQVSDSGIERLREALAEMRRLAADEVSDAWYLAHREFHRQTTAAVAPGMARQIATLREHCERYIRMDRFGHTDAFRRADAEHEALVEAFAARDEPLAVRAIARHLARTALSVMTDVAPELEPTATRAALNLLKT